MTDSDPARPAADASTWAELGRSQFVSLGTFRRSGEEVASPVWIAVDGEDLVVTSERSTGKIKRLRNDPRVTLVPCRRMGEVEAGAVRVIASAQVSGPDSDNRSATAALARKYGFQYRAILGVEKLIRRVRRQPGDRVIIRISRD